jgi:hypothetical protein
MVERDQPEAENNHTERESATKTKITHSLFDLDLDHLTKPPKTASCRARSTLDGEGLLAWQATSTLVASALEISEEER